MSRTARNAEYGIHQTAKNMRGTKLIMLTQEQNDRLACTKVTNVIEGNYIVIECGLQLFLTRVKGKTVDRSKITFTIEPILHKIVPYTSVTYSKNRIIRFSKAGKVRK